MERITLPNAILSLLIMASMFLLPCAPALAQASNPKKFEEYRAAIQKEFGIDVNAICPGSVNTDMLHGILEGDVPKHTMSPEDIVPIALFLASEDSRAITGTAIDAFGMDNPIFRGAALFHKYK